VTLTTAASWAWEKSGKDAMAKATGAAKDKYKEFKWDKAAEAYRAKIKSLYGKMQVMGMAEPVALSGIYVDAYVLSKQTAHQRYAIEELLNRASVLKNNAKLNALAVSNWCGRKAISSF
jgi:hypothetical protein